tara:strand:- start:1066 stop:1968 length:903 start_codon:yes stop_codon:yes gene_type:complete
VKHFNQSLNCKICNQVGFKIYSKSFEDEQLKFFFTNYYGQDKYDNFKKNLEGNIYELLKCNKCKFLWQKYSPSQEFSLELYENIIDKDESLEKSRLNFSKRKKSNFKEIKKIIRNSVEKKLNFLDFGAGWGHWLISGKGLPFQPYAFELSPSKKNFLSSNDIEVLDFDKIHLFENFFHYIRLDQVLEHVDNPNEVLQFIKKLAKKNCIFFVAVPDGKHLIESEKIVSIKKGPIQPLEHLNCFSKSSLKKILILNGFQPLNLKELFIMNLKDFNFDLVSFKSLLLDIRNYFFSTSIKFRIK